jgi:hypothetical protein
MLSVSGQIWIIKKGDELGAGLQHVPSPAPRTGGGIFGCFFGKTASRFNRAAGGKSEVGGNVDNKDFRLILERSLERSPVPAFPPKEERGPAEILSAVLAAWYADFPLKVKGERREAAVFTAGPQKHQRWSYRNPRTLRG